VLLCYLPFVGNAFVSDDTHIAETASSSNVLTVIGWPYAFHLGSIFQMLFFHTVGMTPWPYRLLNILFHVANIILVWHIVRKLTGPRIADIAGLLFAVHPVVVESVTWVAASVYNQYSACFLLSFFLYLRHKEQKSSLSTFLFSVFFFMLSVLVSEKALALPLVFVAYEWFWGNIKRHWKNMIPYFIVSFLLILLYGTRLALRVQMLETGFSESFSGYFNPLIQLPAAFSSYLELIFWPKHLTLYHVDFSYSLFQFIVRASVVVGYLGILAWTIVRKKRIGFWLLWPLVALAPMLTPLKVGWIVAERYAYLATVGIFTVFSYGFDALLSKKIWKFIAYFLGVIILMALCTRTIVRNSEWRNEDTLWVATLRESPQSPNSWNNMGYVYSHHGDEEKAAEMFLQAIAINRNLADAYHNLANSYIRLGKYDEAKSLYEKALSIKPSLWQSHQELAAIAANEDNWQKAEEELQQAIALQQNQGTLWAALAFVYDKQGDRAKAQEAIRHALDLDPKNPQIQSLFQKLGQ